MLSSRPEFCQEKTNGKLPKGKDYIPRLAEGEEYLCRIHVFHMSLVRDMTLVSIQYEFLFTCDIDFSMYFGIFCHNNFMALKELLHI